MCPPNARVKKDVKSKSGGDQEMAVIIHSSMAKILMMAIQVNLCPGVLGPPPFFTACFWVAFWGLYTITGLDWWTRLLDSTFFCFIWATSCVAIQV